MNSAIEKEINALLDLLDDPDIKVIESVSKRFFEIGLDATTALENAWSYSLDENYQEKIEVILDQIYQNHAIHLSNLWCQNNPNDILEGYLALSKFQYPNLDVDLIQKQIDTITKDIWLEINNQLTSLEKTRIINHILFNILEFKQAKSNEISTKYFYVNSVLETKSFFNSSISLIYLIISQKLNLPIYGVLFKDVFLLCYLDFIPEKMEEVSESNVLFYIDAYNYGNVISKERIKEIGNKITNPVPKEDYLPKKPIRLIMSVLKSIIKIENEISNRKKADSLMNFYENLNRISE